VTAKQGSPDPTRDYSDFPAHTVAPDTVMYRSHGSFGAWYFCPDQGCRFDLEDPHGTCYTATDVETAVREKLRDKITASGVVQYDEAAAFRISKLTAPVAYDCAEVNAKTASKYGVVRGISSMDDYGVPQAWAKTLHGSGFGGIFYGSAYTNGAPTAYALFGPTGEPDPSAGFTAEEYLSGVDACAEVGIEVEDIPPPAGIMLI